MKKFLTSIVLTLIVVFCCIGMVGCKDGFELVKSISITTNGEVKKFSSSFEPSFSFAHYPTITEEEYNAAPSERKAGIAKASKITVEDAIKAAKNSTCYKVVEKQLEGFWYSSHFEPFYKRYYYNKSKYEYTYFDFVYVKVKNDTTIVIRKEDTETTYTVTSYNIVKF